MARLFLESGIWEILWHRIAQMLQVSSTAALSQNQPIETLDPITECFSRSDWSLFSMRGLLAALQLAVSVFTKETYHVVPLLASVDDVTVLCVSHMLRQDFLQYIAYRYVQF